MRGKAFMSTTATFTTYKRDNLPHLLRYEKKKLQNTIYIQNTEIDTNWRLPHRSIPQ